MNLRIFDVEHGQCALLTCDNGERMMIDCGHNATTRWYPGDYLASQGVNALKLLVITNYDEDHVSGLPNLLSKVAVENVAWNPSVSAQTLLGLKSECGHGPGVAKVLDWKVNAQPWSAPPQFPGVTWNRFSNPYPTFDDENNLSLALYLQVWAGSPARYTSFLFPGDLEKAGWLALLHADATFREAAKNTGVLIASHHGRESGVCEELFDVYGCAPKLVVISDDCHQYDTQKTTGYYKSKTIGIPYFRSEGARWVLTTRNDGALSFDFNADGSTTVS